jgi:hypothetical protein
MRLCVALTVLAAVMTLANARPLLLPPSEHAVATAAPTTPTAPSLAFPRPPWRKHALMARWLAHEAPYGVLATLAPGGRPVGGVVSVADSSPPPPPAAANANAAPSAPAAAGRLFLYLSPMDELTQNLAQDPRVSLTLTQMSTATGCGQIDPEDPTCARASFLGQAKGPLSGDDEAAAKAALFAKHPAMQTWPDDHSFGAWEVVVDEAHLLDFYGGMAVIKADEYYSAQAPPDDGALPLEGGRWVGVAAGQEAAAAATEAASGAVAAT